MPTLSRLNRAFLALMAVSPFLAPSAFSDGLNITFYGHQGDDYGYGQFNEGFALVQDEREILFADGRTSITLANVSSGIDPATVTFQADGVQIVEQNYDFDLLTPAKLLEKSVGDTVEMIRVNPATGEETTVSATILSVNQGAVLEVDGKIEVLREDNLPTRVIYDAVPENLRASPTLSVNVNSQRSGTRPARLTYLSSGLSWRGDYVAVFDEANQSMDLQGWATIKNTTSTSFENATLNLAAGEVYATSSMDNWRTRQQRRNNQRNRSRTRGGNEASDLERIGDAYLYTLPNPTTVASNQTKQISIIEAEGVKAERVYKYRASGLRSVDEPQNASVHIAFSNSREAGLDAPLPAGAFRIYARDSSGRSQFIGEDEIANSAGGTDLSINIGEAFDITVAQAALSETRPSAQRYEVTMQYTVRNAKSEPATVQITQPIWRSWWNERVVRESHPHDQSRSDELTWQIPVAAEGEATLEFTVLYERP
ncbi:MAG: DUF4139 domain-containing protein [Pseudomonadota bacterium]